MIKITFLGTGYAIPSSERNHSGILLTYQGENILIDCGEGTQRQFRRANLNPCKVTRILISHWHGDHTLGLAGLFQTLSLSGYRKEIFVYGPRGIKENMKNLLTAFPFDLQFKINVQEVDGKFFESEDFYLESKKMFHAVPCNAYSFVIKDKIRIDRNKLKKSKLPNSEILAKLKEGKDITHDGKKYLAKNLTYVEKGKKISFVMDTLNNDKIVSFVKNSDLLVCSTPFSSDLEDHAKEKKHLTSGQAGKIAKISKSKKLLLTHISQRYEKNQNDFLKDARKHFKDSYVTKDFDAFVVE